MATLEDSGEGTFSHRHLTWRALYCAVVPTSDLLLEPDFLTLWLSVCFAVRLLQATRPAQTGSKCAPPCLTLAPCGVGSWSTCSHLLCLGAIGPGVVTPFCCGQRSRPFIKSCTVPCCWRALRATVLAEVGMDQDVRAPRMETI